MSAFGMNFFSTSDGDGLLLLVATRAHKNCQKLFVGSGSNSWVREIDEERKVVAERNKWQPTQLEIDKRARIPFIAIVVAAAVAVIIATSRFDYLAAFLTRLEVLQEWILSLSCH